jgi:hypothetical protein
MKLRGLSTLIAMAIVFALGSSTAFGVVLVPNDFINQPLTAADITALPAGGSFVQGPTALATMTTKPGLGGTIYEGVYQESGGLCDQCLDFVYQLTLSLGGGVGMFTASGYNWDGGLSPDSAFILATTGATGVPGGFVTPSADPAAHTTPIDLGNQETPGNANRSADFDRIHFNFGGFSSPNNSVIFWVHTEATTFASNDIHVQDTGQIDAQGWAPAPEPVSSGLLLGGLFGIGLFVARRFQVRQS